MNTTWMDVSVAQFQIFMLVFVRVIGIVGVSPFFGHRALIGPTNAGRSLMIAMTLFAAVPVTIEPVTDLVSYVLVAAKELVLGMLFGFVARLVFFAVQFAGEVIGLDIGFGVVNVIDPLSPEQISIIGTFKNLIAIITFLIIDGHHILLQALSKSFDMVPIGGISLSAAVGTGIIEMTAAGFTMAIQIAAPVITALFLTSLALGIVARTVPQMNVFIVGFPVQLAVGLSVLVASLPLFYIILNKSLKVLERNYYSFFVFFS